MLHFQAETTLFVCNKWDQVNEAEEHEVTNFICHKIRSIWPNVNPDKQLFKLSCRKEKKRILKKSPPTQNYTNLVEAITKMMSIILMAKMLTHVRWQKYVVQKMIERIASIIVTPKQTNHERDRRITEVECRLSLLENKLKQVKQSALDKVDEKCKAIVRKIVNHLMTSKDTMFYWSESDLKVASDQNNVIGLICARIENEIRTWCIKNKDDVNNEMKIMIQNEFMIVEEDLRIKDGLFGPIDACQSEYVRFAMFGCAVFGLCPTASCFLLGLSFIPNFSVLTLLAYPFLKRKEAWIEWRIGKCSVDAMTAYTYNILENYVTEEHIFKRIEPFIELLKNKVTHICEIIVPRKIAADKMFIDNALKQKRSSLMDIISRYRPIQVQFEMLLGKLEILLVEYFPESKLSFQYINNAKFQHEIGKGSFAIVQSAIISINNEETIVAVKTLKTALDGMYSYKQLSEAIILSKLNNSQQNIMKMYGISLSMSAGQKFLQIYMEYCEDSLFNIVMKKQKPRACGNFKHVDDCKDSWLFVIDIMQGLCSALEYVHKTGLVHRDLKLENILVKEGNSVRLADFGLSKNEENITGTVAGTPLYMAPEVMMGDLYGSEADIYSLGMVLYELWYYRPVFTRPLRSNPSKYEFIFHTRKDLEDKVSKGCRPDCEIPHKPPVELKAIMKICWDANKEKRPSALEVYTRITKVQLN